MVKRKAIARRGLFMVHVGRGKGKTTAAVGLAVRAAGSGLDVFVVQFIKGEWPSGERDFFEAFAALRRRYRGAEKLGTVEVVASGRGFVRILGDRKPFSVHQRAARAALALGRKAVRSGTYDLVILDEALSAVEAKLITARDLVALVRAKPAAVHLVMTGHEAPESITALADLVSDVRMVKHPYYRGVLAQRGIDY